LKDAVNEALRDWTATFHESHYLLGTAAGPHPFPTIVREFHRVISTEAKAQMLERTGGLSDLVVACVGGGSNAIGMFADCNDEEGVELVGAEPGGEGLDSGKHGATINNGTIGILHGARSYLMRNSDGQVEESYSISAGLDYPGVGPQHAHLHATGRAKYIGITDAEALEAFQLLSQQEGIIPALESSHALAYALKRKDEDINILVSLSGRGDQDIDHVRQTLEAHPKLVIKEKNQPALQHVMALAALQHSAVHLMRRTKAHSSLSSCSMTQRLETAWKSSAPSSKQAPTCSNWAFLSPTPSLTARPFRAHTSALWTMAQPLMIHSTWCAKSAKSFRILP